MPQKSFEKSVVWFEKYVAKTLAKMFLVFGREYILDTAAQACMNLTAADLETIIVAEEIKFKGR